MKNLRDVPVGGKAIVKKLEGQGPTKRRIMDMRLRCVATSFQSEKQMLRLFWLKTKTNNMSNLK